MTSGGAGGAELHVLRVFCAPDGAGGNGLGVFLDGGSVADGSRQEVAHELGFAETVFVDDRERAEIRIFTPEIELPLAGHPLVGTAWLLRETGTAVEVLRPPAGGVRVRVDGELTFVAGNPEWGPEFEFVEVGSSEEVERLDASREAHRNAGIWAWLDEDAGVIRERVFAPEVGVAEDEATGSAALRLAARVGRAIEIHQGRGSVIYARPLGDDLAEIGGRVALDEVRSYAL